MYRALYRKYRPLVFADVVGQQSITHALLNQINAGKIGHAFMFTGTRGTGKTSCAKIFAKAVNCLNPNGGDPCGECEICKGLDNGSILDVVEIDAASNNGVDNIRDLRDETAYTPSLCTYKVYIIDEVHMLSMQAFNALLKIMEEPPSHVIFILATTEIHKVPATILSRCQRYDFKRISQEDIAQRISYIAQQEGINLEPAAAELISRLADGAMRDALSILETCLGSSNELTQQAVRKMAGVTDKSYLFELSESLNNKDISKAISAVALLRSNGLDIKRFCEEIINHYRNIMLAGIGTKGLLSGVSAQEEEKYNALSKNISQQAAIRAIKVFGAALERMGKGTDARIELELALFNLCFDEPIAQAPTIAAPPVSPPPQAQKTGFSSAQNGFAPTPNIPQSAPPPPPPVAQTAPKKEPAQKIPQQPLIPQEPFADWQKVVNTLENRDKLLYVNLKESKAYFDGRRVLIDAGELFLEYIRKNDNSKDIIKDTIYEVTGVRCAIGPYVKKVKEKPEETQSAEQTLQQLAAQGVTVEIED